MKWLTFLILWQNNLSRFAPQTEIRPVIFPTLNTTEILALLEHTSSNQSELTVVWYSVSSYSLRSTIVSSNFSLWKLQITQSGSDRFSTIWNVQTKEETTGAPTSRHCTVQPRQTTTINAKQGSERCERNSKNMSVTSPEIALNRIVLEQLVKWHCITIGLNHILLLDASYVHRSLSSRYQYTC